MENKMELLKVDKKFKTFSLENINLPIPKGFITGFVGLNGAGKTTSIKLLLSLLKEDSGEIRYENNTIIDNSYLQDVGVVMDDLFLVKDWKITDVDKAMAIGYDNWQRDKFFDYVEKFGINPKLKVKELSKGMKTKLMLAIAMSHKATLLILDEPTIGLDPSMREIFKEMMMEFVTDENNTVLFSTHITQDLENMSDYIAFIDSGKMVDFEQKDDFLEKYILLKGDTKELDKINQNNIIGKKVTQYGFEALINRKDYKEVYDNITMEIPSINDILVMYGRK